MANLVEFNARTSIEHDARKWLIRMDGDEPLTDTEKDALREWMSRSPLHRSELARLAKFWGQANILTELIAGIEYERRKHAHRRGMSWVLTTWLAAALVLASVIMVYSGLQPSSKMVTRAYGTAIGHRKTALLLDGSSIQLNTDTQVQVAYTSNSRRIRLLRGEALFSVIPDSNRVFEVYAADSVVRAVGTAFAVHLEGRKLDLMVTKGIIDVSDVTSTQDAVDGTSIKAAPLASNLGQLKAGEATSFNSRSGRMEVYQLGPPELQRRLAWQEGYLVFAGEPLSEVVAQLNRYSTTTLAIGDPKLASIAIGARFRIGDLGAVLNLLNTTFGIRARRVNDRSIRLESGPQPQH